MGRTRQIATAPDGVMLEIVAHGNGRGPLLYEDGMRLLMEVPYTDHEIDHQLAWAKMRGYLPEEVADIEAKRGALHYQDLVFESFTAARGAAYQRCVDRMVAKAGGDADLAAKLWPGTVTWTTYPDVD